MEPLKITFSVVGGFVPPPYPLHLDSLAAYAETQFGLDSSNPELPKDIVTLRSLADDLPFAKHEEEGDWVWKSSAIIPEGDVNHTSRFYTQRMDKAAFADHVGSGLVQMGRYEPDLKLPPGKNMKPYQGLIDTLRGPHRNMLGYYPLMDVSKLVAWCIGDKEVLEELFIHSGLITHLGARRRSGHGTVSSVSVDTCDEANELWKLRVRPWQMRDDDAMIQAAWHPPYWASENKGRAYCPTSLL